MGRGKNEWEGKGGVWGYRQRAAQRRSEGEPPSRTAACGKGARRPPTARETTNGNEKQQQDIICSPPRREAPELRRSAKKCANMGQIAPSERTEAKRIKNGVATPGKCRGAYR